MSQTLNAQSACDKLFSNGVKLQQTMTIQSQKKAITYFGKAKVCYDSQAKKNLCDQQIVACRNIIAQITKQRQKKIDKKVVHTEETEVTPIDSVVAVTVEEKGVEIFLGCNYLKFKAKGEFKKAKVTCNYPDWNIKDIPSWVNCSKNDNDEIVIEAKKNSTKEERSCVLKIECRGEYVTLTIIQEKPKKFIIL
ncbi:MAG: BACON domain-containing protein [Elusimicrobiales bacterium]|nr:BACON domain-containing protein [Elusimicrobiales bacterium]